MSSHVSHSFSTWMSFQGQKYVISRKQLPNATETNFCPVLFTGARYYKEMSLICVYKEAGMKTVRDVPQNSRFQGCASRSSHKAQILQSSCKLFFCGQLLVCSKVLCLVFWWCLFNFDKAKYFWLHLLLVLYFIFLNAFWHQTLLDVLF